MIRPEQLPEWRREMTAQLRSYAQDLRTLAARHEQLADKIECPPEGVRVEYGGPGTVRFVTTAPALTVPPSPA